MSKKGKPKRRVVPLEELGGSVLAESATEGSDLACALIAGAFIENILGDLLSKVLIPGEVSDGLLNNPLGILSTAAGRADMCYCLGLIDNITHGNAKQIARIRNRFAHSHAPIDFNEEEVRNLCDSLKAPPLVDKNDKPIDSALATSLLANPRQKFVATALGTFVYAAVVSLYSKSQSPVDHRVRCPVSDDASSVVGAVVFFNE